MGAVHFTHRAHSPTPSPAHSAAHSPAHSPTHFPSHFPSHSLALHRPLHPYPPPPPPTHPSQLSLIVLEKELGLRQALRTMGMLDSTYWLSIMTYEGIMVLVVSLLISIMGLICGFDLFRNNAFVNYWGLFFTFGLAMTSFAMFLSVFLKRYDVCG